MSSTLDVFDLTGRIAQETTIPGAWNTFFAGAKQAGFVRGIASLVPADMTSPLSVFAHDLPSGWAEHYAEEGYNTVDTVAARATQSRHPFEWRAGEWADTPTPLQKQWQDHVLSMGCTRGYLVPDRSSGELAAISLAGDFDSLDPHDRMKLHFAGIEVLARMREIGIGQTLKPGKALSSRECECLKWVAAGKTDWEIGVILSLSEKTVSVYIERAKQKLGVQTRAQAIVQAVREKLINL